MSAPNLFSFATSELSQDAFLCWLISWADPACKSFDENLNNLALSFLVKLFEKHGKKFPEINTIEIKRQYNNMDILTIINDQTIILIEDKINTTEHSDQLFRYISQLKQEYPDKLILPTYIQTGEQGNYQPIKDAGFVPFLRSDLIDLMNLNKYSIKNNIVIDFYHYLKEIENQVQAFLTVPLDDWEWYAWTGFYNKIQEVLKEGEWAYVPNPSGGFLAYYWKWHGDDNCEQYLQMEENKLCFKIWVKDDNQRQELRQLWHSKIVEKGHKSSLHIIKPPRFGNGQWMTVAVVEGDYRKTSNNGNLDFTKTIEVIREAEKVLHDACQA